MHRTNHNRIASVECSFVRLLDTNRTSTLVSDYETTITRGRAAQGAAPVLPGRAVRALTRLTAAQAVRGVCSSGTRRCFARAGARVAAIGWPGAALC